MDSPSIKFGSITSTGGATRLSGTNSSIDTDSLVTALTNAKKLPAIRLNNTITKNETKVAALKDMRTILSNIQSAVEGLRNPPGALGQDSNLFEQKQAYLTSSSGAAPAEIAGVSVANRAQPGSFKLVVDQLATAAKLASNSVAGLSQKLGDQFGSFSGAIGLGVAGGESVDIQVDGTMTIQDVRNAINSRSTTTGITASVLQVASGDVRLVLTAKETGKAIVMTNGSAGTGDDVLATLGLSDDGGATIQNSIQEARSARFSVDGVAVERLSNKVDDVLQGVTLNLFKSDPGTMLNVEVERSLGGVQDKITALVDAYNAFRDFAAQQDKVGADGVVSVDSPLFGNSLLRQIQSTVVSALGGTATGASGSLREMGITLDSTNRMQIDSAKLENALVTKLDQVRNIMEFRYESGSADLSMFARSGSLQDTDFAVAIVDADGDGQIETASIDGVPVDVAGKVIKGRQGTPYAGLQFIWAGSGTVSIDVHASQGVADKTYDALSKILDLTEGRLAKEVDQIQTSTTRAQAEIDKINERADRYRDQLIIRFSALETALGQAQSMLQQIKATFGQNNSN